MNVVLLALLKLHIEQHMYRYVLKLYSNTEVFMGHTYHSYTSTCTHIQTETMEKCDNLSQNM